ncbi:MAG: ABC transporter ATP-binding protein [Acetobacteraceae bacterium]|nr:ABC transporter ATP-binding protein [Acetobacteraceae bacterium]
MLNVNNIEVVFDGTILVLKGVSFTAHNGKITTLLGANGAGKTTTLKAISGLLAAERGAVTHGSIELDGKRLDHMGPHDIVAGGVAQVFEGRRVFEGLSVEENLIVGAHTRSNLPKIRGSMEEVYTYFPLLKERRRQAAGYLSGGEQQMLAIGRALMSDPSVILFDEPSLGLAPLIVENIFRIIARLRDEGNRTILLVEQNAALALAIADHAYVMETGRIALEGSAAELRENAEIRESYLGLNDAGTRRSYRDVKRSRRRQRWLA